MATGGDMVTLNVGGTKFTTTITTLRAAPYFAAMFDPDSGRPPAQKDEKGNYFIDRNPKAFEVRYPPSVHHSSIMTKFIRLNLISPRSSLAI